MSTEGVSRELESCRGIHSAYKFGGDHSRGDEMIKGILLVLALTAVGILLGFAVVWGVWELANPRHAPENFAGGMLGLLLGAPGGGIIGFIFGTVLATRWFGYSAKKADARKSEHLR